MMDKTGLQRLAIHEKDDAFNIQLVGTEGSLVDKDAMVKSKNSRYILNKINNDENGITQKLRELFLGGDSRVKSELHIMMQHLLRDLRPPNLNEGGLTHDAARILTMKYHGHEVEMHAGVKANIKDAYDKYMQLQDNYNKCLDSIDNLVSLPKWMFMAYGKAMYCGAYNLKVMDDVKRFAARGSYSFEYRATPEVIHPLRAYQTMQDIHPEFRESAMAAWTIFKLYTEKHASGLGKWINDAVPESSDGYMRIQDAGAILWTNGYLRYMLLDMPV